MNLLVQVALYLYYWSYLTKIHGGVPDVVQQRCLCWLVLVLEDASRILNLEAYLLRVVHIFLIYTFCI